MGTRQMLLPTILYEESWASDTISDLSKAVMLATIVEALIFSRQKSGMAQGELYFPSPAYYSFAQLQFTDKYH